LSTERLKLSAVVISLFHGPFSVSTAAKVLGIDPTEAIVQLEGLAARQIISVVDEEAKERKYDIHPILRKYAESIKNHEDFVAPYLEAKGRFYELFMSRMEKIAKLIEPEYVRAFHLFETDRGNYEFTVDISLQPEYFSVPGEFRENALIASLFIAMLNDNQYIMVFHAWAEMCEDDGKGGSLGRAQLKSWEAKQVADVDGTERGFEMLREALNSLEKVEDQTSESFMLAKGFYLQTEGEILWRNRDHKKALATLELSLTFSEPLLKEHTDIARCYNAIGNTFYALDQPSKALEFYEKAFKMQEKLAGSENHFDMPMYKNQIGTAYEGLKDYEKAVQCYKDALDLLKELKLLGYEDEALFCRNLANALMFLEKYKDAIEPSERAYSIRKKLLGNHPQTVRSIFQRGVLQANLGHRREALHRFLEAWEMEKTLGVGNQSEVWRMVIKGVEDMYDYTITRRLKKSFRKEVFEFCQHFWEEQRDSPQFSFNKFNKDIIDALKDFADDKKDKDEARRQQLWFYEEMNNASEKEFEEKFELESDSDALCVMLKERDNLLDELVKLYSQLHDRDKLVKYKKDKLALYEMSLLKAGFLGNKKDGLDKASLKGKVEKLYKETRQKGSILEFRQRLLACWQTQWEEGKSKEKTKKIAVERETIIDGVLNLCQELKEVNMYRRYGQEALSFYEEIWEMKHAEMKDPEMKKLLRKLKELASSIRDDTSEKLYKNALQALIGTGKHLGAVLRPRATQTTPKPKEEEKDSEEEDEEIEIDSEQEIEIGSEETKVEELYKETEQS
ncbi:uncharacterized protein LOC111319829, partial [Stylophora pistillata]|uniref:uncharacterized protein LOC111319829 n=1 Tax=Stylophora pistillata TaxID=50429 RepID=UPI000C0491B1